MFVLHKSKNDTSVTLDLLRAVAAQMVCVGHGISFFMPAWRPSELPLMQNVGVLIFFVLSGTLITFTLIERSKDRKIRPMDLARSSWSGSPGYIPASFLHCFSSSSWTALSFTVSAKTRPHLITLQKHSSLICSCSRLIAAYFRTTYDGLHSARPVRYGHWQSNGTFTCSSAPSSSYGPGLSSACS